MLDPMDSFKHPEYELFPDSRMDFKNFILKSIENYS